MFRKGLSKAKITALAVALCMISMSLKEEGALASASSRELYTWPVPTSSQIEKNYSDEYDGSAHGVIVKVNDSAWDGKAIVSGINTSYGQTVTTTGTYDTDYTLKPTYTDYSSSAKTVYYKVTGGTYYEDYTGSGDIFDSAFGTL